MDFYFQRRDGEPVTPEEYAILCNRFACEAYGCPVFGPYDESTFEVPSGRNADLRRNVLESRGFVEVPRPQSPRTSPQAFAHLL